MAERRYKFRAECLADVGEFFKAVNFPYTRIEIVRAGTVPDCTVEFTTEGTSLDALRAIMADIPDGHVMRESVNLVAKYTGERYYHQQVKRVEKIPKDFAVQPLKPGEEAKDKATCGHCGLSWDDGKSTQWTPAPSGRCPFEYFHKY